VATQPEKLGALPVDITKVSGYGTSPESLQELRDALQQNITALEQRYAQPNWFNVAAGFLKPQLGGFFASLGSASQALGENVERQRAAQLPIAQMRAQLAQSNILMGQQQKVAQMEKDRIASGRKVTPDYVREVSAIAGPDSTVAKALQAELESTRKQFELAISTAQAKMNAGQSLAPHEIELLNQAMGYLGAGQGPVAPSQGAQPPGSATTFPVSPGAPSGEPAVKFNLQGLSPQDQIRVLSKGMGEETDPAVVQGIARKIGELGAPSPPPAPAKPTYYPRTLVMPKVEGMSTAEREATTRAYTEQAIKQESVYQDKLNNMSSLATGPNYTATANSYDSVIGMIRDNPELSKKVFNIIRQHGQIAAALQTGIGMSVGNWGASINVPVEAFLRAGLTEKEQQFADQVSGMLVSLGAAKLKASGQTTANTTQTEYVNMLRSAAGLDQTPASALLTLLKDQAAFNMNKEIYDVVMRERDAKADPQSLTKLTDVFKHSSELKRIDEKYQKINQRLDSQFSATIRGTQ